ncbi:hypothetical protein EHM82_02825 [bacterium]|nr:MAG: hypothetical protein EHM82_02825 [bacterium]
MSKKIFTTLALALFVFAGVASSQDAAGSQNALVKALEDYAAQVKAGLPSGEGAVPKAVPRLDKAEAVFIGRLELVDDIDFLDDGTPFRIVAIRARRPVDQFHFIFCLGSAFTNSCGRLREGRRVQFTADILTLDEGDEAGLALFVAKRIKT